MNISNFSFPAPIVFGAGALALLPDRCRGLGVHRPLVVTDGGLVRVGLVARVVAGLGAPTVFDATPANPTISLPRTLTVYGASGLGGGPEMFAPVVGFRLKPKVPGDGIEGVHVVVTPTKPQVFRDILEAVGGGRKGEGARCNAVQIDQRVTVGGRVLGVSTGAADQSFALLNSSSMPKKVFREQAAALEERGVDLFLLETFSDPEDLTAAVAAIRSFSRLPVSFYNRRLRLRPDANIPGFRCWR